MLGERKGYCLQGEKDYPCTDIYILATHYYLLNSYDKM